MCVLFALEAVCYIQRTNPSSNSTSNLQPQEYIGIFHSFLLHLLIPIPIPIPNYPSIINTKNTSNLRKKRTTRILYSR